MYSRLGTERLERVLSSRRAMVLEMGRVLMILPQKNADGYERWREEEEERREKRREVMGSEASSGVNKLSMGGTTVVESSVYGRSTGNRVATTESVTSKNKLYTLSVVSIVDYKSECDGMCILSICLPLRDPALSVASIANDGSEPDGMCTTSK